MKIAVFGMPYFNYTESLCYGYENLGHDVMMVKSIPDLDLVKTKEEILAFKPDLFVNFCGNYEADNIDKLFLEKLVNCKKVTMFADSVKGVTDIEQYYCLYDEVYVFEASDVGYLKEKYGINAKIGVASVAEEIFCQNFGEPEKKYDLSFVGCLLPERLEFFEKIAKYAYENNLSMILFGEAWPSGGHWQAVFGKRKFAKKYPFLVKFCTNMCIIPEGAAILYKQTRICLNKHIDRHQAMGSRTFEIMATGSFELCDERDQSKGYGLVDGKNIAFYKDVNDCIKKIEYYLKNDSEREKIATAGAKLVREKHTTKESLRRGLEEIFRK